MIRGHYWGHFYGSNALREAHTLCIQWQLWPPYKYTYPPIISSLCHRCTRQSYPSLLDLQEVSQVWNPNILREGSTQLFVKLLWAFWTCELFKLCITGKIPVPIRPHFCSVSLSTVRKEDGGIRPITDGNTLHNMVAREALKKATLVTQLFGILHPLYSERGNNSPCYTSLLRQPSPQ